MTFHVIIFSWLCIQSIIIPLLRYLISQLYLLTHSSFVLLSTKKLILYINLFHLHIC